MITVSTLSNLNIVATSRCRPYVIARTPRASPACISAVSTVRTSAYSAVPSSRPTNPPPLVSHDVTPLAVVVQSVEPLTMPLNSSENRKPMMPIATR